MYNCGEKSYMSQNQLRKDCKKKGMQKIKWGMLRLKLRQIDILEPGLKAEKDFMDWVENEKGKFWVDLREIYRIIKQGKDPIKLIFSNDISFILRRKTFHSFKII